MDKRVYYWDSSALIKRYIKEVGSESMLSVGGDSPNFTATLSHAEISATLYRLRREGRVSEREFGQLWKAFLNDWQRLLLIDYRRDIQLIAESAIQKSPLKGADLVHLSSAVKLVREGLDVVLLTFDRQLEKAAHDHQVVVFG